MTTSNSEDLTSHTRAKRWRLAACILASLLLLAACGSSSDGTVDLADDAAAATTTPNDDDTDHDDTDQDDTDHDDTDHDHDDDTEDSSAPAGSVDPALFFDGALVGDVTTEDCTLSGGAETTCYRMTVAGFPASYEVGPFCPSTITDGANAGGLWWDGNAIYDLDGEFITSLAELYGDDTWQLYDEDGNVNVTETAEEFDLAARPDVDESLQNHCVEGRLEWLDNGEPVQSTVVIPIQPVAAGAAAAPQGNQGVTLDGVVIANSAPVDAILGAFTIAAFDDCGAHFNPTDGYHMHGAVGCSELGEVSDGETPMFGYAMDGYPIHSPIDAADAPDLDECNGHTTEDAGYHYHANSAEQNQVVECLMGQTVAGAGDAGGGRPDGPPPGAQGDADDAAGDAVAGDARGGPDLTEAAEALGVSADELETALGQPPFDLDAAASSLGVSAADLQAVLPAPPDGGGGRPDDGAVAGDDETATTALDQASDDDIAARTAVVQDALWADGVQITIDGSTVRFESNGLPSHEYLDIYLGDGPDGKFIAGGVDAYNASFDFPLIPTLAATPSATGNGAIGVAISGAVFFNPYEGDGSATVANDDNSTIDGIPFIDACGGHPLPNGQSYHYHGIPFCITDAVDTVGEHSTLIGYLFDGNPIYGPQDVDGEEPTDLDACLGHTGPTPEFDEDVYHYHVISTANYISECFTGIS